MTSAARVQPAAAKNNTSISFQKRVHSGPPSEERVQVLLGGLLTVLGSRRAVRVPILLQHGDHVVVAEVRRFVHRRVPPSVERKHVREAQAETLETFIHVWSRSSICCLV